MEKAYLMKSNGNIVERPQYMLMRVAIGIHQTDLKSAFKTYDLMSSKLFTHASPTLFNSGTKYPQLSSCFLSGTRDDIEGIYKTITDCALISKRSGGIGIHVSNIRAAGSLIRTTNGKSDGIVPMLQVYNYTVYCTSTVQYRYYYCTVLYCTVQLPVLSLRWSGGGAAAEAFSTYYCTGTVVLVGTVHVQY